jgi:hypothetical protein
MLVTEQYSFRKGISTEVADFRLTGSVFKSINQECMLEEFFCDLAKALDCINHEIFLAKLHNRGIQGVSEDWFTSYLTNRRQKIEVKSPNTAKTFSLTRVH